MEGSRNAEVIPIREVLVNLNFALDIVETNSRKSHRMLTSEVILIITYPTFFLLLQECYK